MIKLSYSVRIDAPKALVWHKMRQFGNVAVWTDSVKQSYCTGSQCEGVGATRACKTPGFGTIHETVTQWKADEGFSYEATLPIAKYAKNTWALTEDGSQSVVNIQPEFEIRFGVFGRLLERFVMMPQLKKQLPTVLAEFKYYVEHGRSITEETRHKLKLSAVS